MTEYLKETKVELVNNCTGECVGWWGDVPEREDIIAARLLQLIKERNDE